MVQAIFKKLQIAALSGFTMMSAQAADYPQPVQKFWTAKNFAFHTGEVFSELKIAYTTVGSPGGKPVLLLHGTMGSASNFLNAQYAGELFGEGQPLDARTHYIIIPDAIGTGKTTKPSDGLKTKFPKYNYADMVRAQHQLLSEGLGVNHLSFVMGSSMGGMHTWMWGEMFPDFMDALIPMSSTPAPMSGRNWMTRRLLIETIKRDPEYKGGNYEAQPPSMKFADAWFGLTTSGGNLGTMIAAPDAITGDKLVAARLDAPVRGDANDMIYQYGASSDYDPSPSLEKIKARVLSVNSADDERNPIDLGLLERSMKRIQKGQYFLIPTSAETRGHGTVGLAKLWKAEFAKFLAGSK